MKKFYQRKGVFGKVAISKIFEYSTLGSEFPKKQYQELEKVYEFDKNEGDNVEVLQIIPNL